MKRFFILQLTALVFSAAHVTAQQQVAVAPQDVFFGNHLHKVWLQSFDTPKVSVTDAVYSEVKSLPDSVATGRAETYKIILGKERKRPFLALQMPAYKKEDGKLYRLTSYKVAVTEKENKVAADNNLSSLQRTTAPSSVLASGQWYKIAVSSRGIARLDYDFVKTKLGISGSIASAKIRLFGNGGTMLPEGNATFRYDDLQENAIVVNDGGDGVFNNNDYILFYTTGPTAWSKDSANGQFHHQKNIYEDKSYYFLTIGQENGLRIAQKAATTGTPNVTVETFNDYTAHEEDLYNIGAIGKEWMGEQFAITAGKKNTYSFSFSLGQVSGNVNVRSFVGSASSGSSNVFYVSANGQQIDNIGLGMAVVDDNNIITANSFKVYELTANNNLALTYTYQPGASDGLGYLNYIELNWRRQLSFAGGQLSFRDWKSAGAGNIAKFNIGSASAAIQVWDVTNPLVPAIVPGSLSGSTYSFNAATDALHEYTAHDGSSYNGVEYIGAVANQNLHALPQYDMIIITYPDFADAANKLAAWHREYGKLSVLVETPARIYNEFSSGGQDICGIRDFIKMFYDRAGSNTSQLPKHVLLFGDASYDYKNRLSGNTNFVPTYESDESAYILNAYSNDDIYGFLDDNENIATTGNTLDVGVGRLTAQTADDANAVVNKIIHYKNSATMGPWRLKNTYIADNEDDAGEHMSDAENAQQAIDATTNIYTGQKVYLDNLQFVSTPGGARCPAANTAINNDIYKGTFLINYTGHGNIATLAHERILTADDYNTWTNYDKLPFMITGTCDFAQFDNPAATSSGEKLVMKSNGGAIAMLTTTQAVYASENAILNKAFLTDLFTKDNDNWRSFGEAFRTAKNYIYINNPGSTINSRKFVFLGDPALMPNFPEHKVQTDSITDNATLARTDSVKALGSYAISGSVVHNNQVLTDFNGTLDVTFYDKKQKVNVVTARGAKSFYVENNILYKGKASVTNGRFTFSFIAPKDLNYDFGKGKISYYADNGTTDAAGIDSSVTVGGSSDHPFSDDDAPIVKPYINDSLFKDGGVTGTNTSLYVSLFDETGINVTGNSVGHDLTAVLDGDATQPMILNDYYQTRENDYQHGYLTYPVTGLADGKHSITVKAWDVNNNSGEGTVNFVVYNGKVVVINKLGNYPNPFSNLTHFVFEHNHPDEDLGVVLKIYNTQGVLVKTINQNFTPDGSRTNELTWDGTGDNGAQLPNGMYVYRMRIATSSGIEGMAYEKLIILR